MMYVFIKAQTGDENFGILHHNLNNISTQRSNVPMRRWHIGINGIAGKNKAKQKIGQNKQKRCKWPNGYVIIIINSILKYDDDTLL